MSRHAFRLVNVFAETRFGGNPLCVFEDARGIDDQTMQALALQFNLSETTFILPSARAAARVRVFTTGYEMPFAGHPTLGTAYVVSQLLGSQQSLSLEFNIGVVPVSLERERWTLTAPALGAPKIVRTANARAELAAFFGLEDTDLLDQPCWVDTGTDQLLFPLRSTEAVRRAEPNGALLSQWPLSSLARKSAYLFAIDDNDPTRVVCRYFFTKDGTGVAEDPGTGSACANLGGWLLSRGSQRPVSLQLEQGDAIDRPCRLYLSVTADGQIRVGGRVVELGRGTIEL